MQAPPLKDKSAARSNLAKARVVSVQFRTLTGSGDHPQVVVVAHRPSGPSSEEDRLRLGDHLAERSGRRRLVASAQNCNSCEDALRPRVLGADADHLDIGHLTDQISIVILVNKSAKFSQQLQSARLVAGMDQLLPIEGIVRSGSKMVSLGSGFRGGLFRNSGS